ncbi:LacI family DNA-binding transcriptional regulator [Kitasatospora purpeofusca]|uniref:LacI family DNA-binding transcriptional regulator n=1 Tax=Kitasatospora purpeofusca TaxID=67352 RepID=UPI003807BDA7
MNERTAARPKRVTIDDLATAAGVSRQTVSRAINDKGEIDPSTRRRILDIARSLGYRPNRFARAMVHQDEVTLGLLVPNIVNPYFPEVADGVLEAASALGWHVVMHRTRATLDGELGAVRLMARQVDAFVGYLGYPEAVREARDSGLPFALLDGEVLDALAPEEAAVGRVEVDLESGVRQALDHLVQLGHRRIGLLDAGGTAQPSPRGRHFDHCAREFGLSLGPGLRRPGRNSVEGGRLAMGELLDEHPGVTAVLAYNDLVALGAVRAVRGRGLRVPEHCSVVGFDGLSVADLVDPALTTLHIDKRRLGAESVRLAAAALADPGVMPERVVVRPELVVRESTGPAAV